MTHLSLTTYAYIPPALAQARVPHERWLRRFPMADPARIGLGRAFVAPAVADNLGLLTFPAVLFEALPLLRKSALGPTASGAPNSVMTRPSVETLQHFGAHTQGGLLAIQLASAMFRALSALEGVELEWDKNLGVMLPRTTDPDLLSDPEKCWPSRAGIGGGHASPVMRLRGKLMTVAEAFLNFAYPAVVPVHYSLRKRCKTVRCVNPWHALPSTLRPATLATLDVAIALPPGRSLGAPPFPTWSPLENHVSWVGSWADWCSRCEAALSGLTPTSAPVATPENFVEPTPDDFLAAADAGFAD